DLQRFRDGRPVIARPAPLVERGWRWCRRRPALASLLVALAVALAGGGIANRYQLHQTEIARGDAVAGQERLREVVRALIQSSPVLPLANAELALPSLEPLDAARTHC